MRTALSLLAALMSVSPLLAAQAVSGSTRLLVTFKEGTSADQQARALQALGARSIEAWEGLDAAAAVVDEGRAGLLSEAALGDPAVEAVEEDRYLYWLKAGAAGFEAAPLPSWQEIQGAIPAFRRPSPARVADDDDEIPWGVARVNAPAAWGLTQGEGARVAVIDSGMDASHPDLSPNAAGCFNAISPGYSCSDGNGHGTHVAGTIAAVRDGRGVAGVAPQARLYAVKVLDSSGSGRVSWIAKGVAWCADNGIQVANMSLGSDEGSSFLRRAIQRAATRGVTIVASAGNSDGGAVGYPAAYPETIAVTASDEVDGIASFSSRGAEVDFIAPGAGIKSTVPYGGYDWHSGTSMAAPHVTGLAALAVSRGARGPQAVREALGRAAVSLGLPSAEQGHGLIDARLIGR